MFIRISFLFLFVFCSSSVVWGNPFAQKMERLEELQSLIKMSKSDIKKLMSLKKKSTSVPKRAQMEQQIDVKHRSYMEYVKEFKAIQEELLNRFPDKVKEIKGIISGEQQTNGQLEQEMELEARLDRLKAKIDKKYKPLNRETAAEKTKWEEKIKGRKEKKEQEQAIEFIQ